MKTILCIDGNSILNRAFYGIRPLSNKAGVPTNGVYGFVNILSGQLEQLKPDYLVAAFDLKEPTFRHKAYADYKAGRHETPPELLTQFPIAKDCARAMGFHIAEVKGYEADDVLGTCAAMAKENDCHAYLLTGDRDALQLVSDNVTVLLATNKENIPFTPEKFFEVYGITPDRFVDVKALMGDSSDNIPGVRGIGEKTALKLIASFGSIETLYEQTSDPSIAKGVREKLTANEESARFSKFLATIATDAPVGFTLDEVQNSGYDKSALKALFVELEFFKFIHQFHLDDVPAAMADDDAAPAAELPEILSTAEDILKSDKLLSFYTEQDTCYLSDGKTVYIVPFEDAETLSALAANRVVYDAKALYHAIDRRGGTTVEVAFDVMLGAYCLSPAEKCDLPRLLLSYCHRSDGEALTPAQTAGAIFALYEIVETKLRETKMDELYHTIELPLAYVLFEMEKTGFCVDTNGLRAFGDRLGAMCDMYAQRIDFAAGETFNINSPKQLGEVLFDRLGLPSPTKKRSTSAEVLEKLRPYHAIIGDILDYRQVMKLKSTYADGLLKVADESGRIHTTFHQTVTATGRLSSTEPNLQNIPIRTELGRELRRFFITEDSDHVLIDADYSQIELRLLAAISGDETMIKAFSDGVDIHAVTASEVFGVPLAQVTPEMRKRAKAVNFGIVYGIGDYSLSGDIGVSRKQAAAYIASYLATYPKVDAYLHDVVAQAKQDGYVTTIFNRRRYIPELRDTKKPVIAFGERVAMNSPIQGSAADIIKLAMIHIAKKLRDSGLDARLILQVHDELIVSCRRSDAETVRALLRDEMEHTVNLPVPLTVDVQTGDNWFDGH